MEVVELPFLVLVAIMPWEGVLQPYYLVEVVQRMYPVVDLPWQVEA